MSFKDHVIDIRVKFGLPAEKRSLSFYLSLLVVKLRTYTADLNRQALALNNS